MHHKNGHVELFKLILNIRVDFTWLENIFFNIWFQYIHKLVCKENGITSSNQIMGSKTGFKCFTNLFKTARYKQNKTLKYIIECKNTRFRLFEIHKSSTESENGPAMAHQSAIYIYIKSIREKLSLNII